jgi:hypothetical protein
MREYFKQTPFTTFVLLYLFFCGGLYLIAYWGTFDIDISNMVSIFEIPKSFVMPLAVSGGMALLHIVSLMDSYKSGIEVLKGRSIDGENVGRKARRLLLSEPMLFIYAMLIIIISYDPFKTSSAYWIMCGYAVSVGLTVNISKVEKVRELISNTFLRTVLIAFVIYTPIMSFCLGKGNAYQVLSNRKVKYVTINTRNSFIIQRDSSSLKLLGFLGDKLIVSSLDNQRIYVLNQSEYGTVQVIKKDDEPNKPKP